MKSISTTTATNAIIPETVGAQYEDELSAFGEHYTVFHSQSQGQNNNQGQGQNGNRKQAAKRNHFTTKNQIGTRIRNAVSGYTYEQYRVGQATESLFFKVCDCTTFSAKEAATTELLFYDSPEEFETHKRVKLAPRLKEQWYLKYETLLRSMEKPRKLNPQPESESDIMYEFVDGNQLKNITMRENNGQPLLFKNLFDKQFSKSPDHTPQQLAVGVVVH